MEWRPADIPSRVQKQPAESSLQAIVANLQKQLAKYKETWKEILTKIREDVKDRKQRLEIGRDGASS